MNSHKFWNQVAVTLTALLALFVIFSSDSEACSKEDEYNKVTELAYFEARSESFQAQVAVATVAVNRLYTGKFGNNLCEVIEQPHQFSYFHDGLPEIMNDPKAKEVAEEVANCVVNNHCSHAALYGVTHYYACKGAYGITPPYWVDHFRFVAQIGNHCFYREV